MAASSQASLLLQKQLKDLMKNPVDGFSAGLVDDKNVFEWSVTIMGPPDTLYQTMARKIHETVNLRSQIDG